MSQQTVSVIGLGYIGLPTAAMLASKNFSVLGVDINQATVDAVNAGNVPFVEPDLGAYLAGAVNRGTLRASTTPAPADVFVIAVPTPFRAGPHGDHAPDLSYIQAAATAIAPHLRGGELVILESTSPPGATAQLGQWLTDANPELSLGTSTGADADAGNVIHLAHCPERVLPGRVMIELVTNDRIVGGLSPHAAELAKALYETFCQGTIHLTDAVTAEMAKLVENSFRDVNIAFANELSLICDELGIDVWELIALANHHPRVDILQPGPGVGGHCIAVDPWFIVDTVPDLARLIRTAREVNDHKPDWVLGKVRAAVAELTAPARHAAGAGPDGTDATDGTGDAGTGAGLKIAALGLAFKPDIDDLRESPARRIVAELADEFTEATIWAVEPHITALPGELANRRNVELAELAGSLAQADIIVLLVDHSVFGEAPARQAAAAATAAGRVVIDTRGAWR